MLRISSKGRYASRLMLDLALQYGRGPIFLKNIAERQELSEKYLSQLVVPLKVAGLINSSRGAHGGYSLAQPPKKVTLAAIVLAVEGKLEVVECVGSRKVCDRVDACIVRDIWSEVSGKIITALESFTLQDMVERHRKKVEQYPLSYAI
ncbi:RrF2 family transcriptional regulator [Candidatus Omnitrophota bacterium]